MSPPALKFKHRFFSNGDEEAKKNPLLKESHEIEQAGARPIMFRRLGTKHRRRRILSEDIQHRHTIFTQDPPTECESPVKLSNESTK